MSERIVGVKPATIDLLRQVVNSWEYQGFVCQDGDRSVAIVSLPPGRTLADLWIGLAKLKEAESFPEVQEANAVESSPEASFVPSLQDELSVV